jgi:hypothetical protein
MLAHPVVAAVSDRRRRSEIDATIYVPPYNSTRFIPFPRAVRGDATCNPADGGTDGASWVRPFLAAFGEARPELPSNLTHGGPIFRP